MVRRTLLLPVLLAISLGGAPALQAQGWGDLDALMARSFGPDVVSAYWLPDHLDPAQAQSAVAIAYLENPHGGNAVGIAGSLFTRTPQGFAQTLQITGVYGMTPRDAVFSPTHVELTTTMPGPNDPRCCPTVPTRWRIDRTTGVAARLN
ncbi:MAG: hypothetical protein NXH97_11675 [Rhodobacteraceae bacterium]|nr:hypothetical protein [Paracoccaceae bacterium]